MPPTLTVPKGQKKVLVRQCLNELGTDTSFGAAKRWFKKNHNLSLADATFYHVRKDMRKEAARPSPVPAPAPKPIRAQVHSIVELVKTAKELVDKLGKDEVRQLIDIL